MNRLVSCLICLFALGSVPAGRVLAAPYDLMLDVSGSMRGFQAAGGPWTAIVTGLAAEARFKYQFGTTPGPWDGRLEPNLFKETDTFLDKAIEYWRDRSGDGNGLVVITDNVADDQTSKSSTDPQENFYKLLKGADSIFSNIEILPVRLPFNGSIYKPGEKLPGVSYPKDKRAANAPRALGIYLLVRGGGDATGKASDDTLAQLKRTAEEILRRAGIRFGSIPIKPFKPPAAATANVVIREAPERSSPQPIRLDPEFGLVISDFPLGEPLVLSFDAKVTPGPDFTVREAQFIADINFEDAENLTTDRRVEVEVSPAQADVVAGNARTFLITFKKSPFNLLEMPWSKKLELSLQNNTEVKGMIRLSYVIERPKIDLAAPMLAEWSYEGSAGDLIKPDEAIQSKIYRLGALARGVVPEQALRQDIVSIPVYLQLRYPIGPMMTLGLLAALAAGGLFFFLRQASKHKSYVIEEDGREQQVTPGFGNPVQIASSDGRTSIRLRPFGLFTWVSSADRLRSGPLLFGDSNKIEVQAANEDDSDISSKYVFRMRSARQHAAIIEQDEWSET